MPRRAELLNDTRFQRVTAAIIAGAIGRTAVELYGDLEELRVLKVRLGAQELTKLIQWLILLLRLLILIKQIIVPLNRLNRLKKVKNLNSLPLALTQLTLNYNDNFSYNCCRTRFGSANAHRP